MHNGETHNELIRLLREHRRIGFICHIRPDGDTIGSAFALSLAVRAMGGDSVVFCQHPVPYKLQGLAAMSHFTMDLQDLSDCDLLGAIDCAAPDRLGAAQEFFMAHDCTFCLDHHGTNPCYAGVNWVQEESATGMLALQVIRLLGVELTPDMADCLYAAIVTDTGRFAFSLTTPQAMRDVADLMEAGAHFTDLQEILYRMGPLSERRLLGACLSTLDTPNDGAMYLMHISREMLHAAGATWEDAEGFVNYALDIYGARTAVLLSELFEGQGWKVSLRSRGDLRVDTVAQAFGGGGHRNAAGCQIPGTLEEAKASLLAECAKQGVL